VPPVSGVDSEDTNFGRLDIHQAMRHNRPMTENLNSTDVHGSIQSTRADLNPALKSWIDDVIVPALVDKWIAMNQAENSESDRTPSPAQQTEESSKTRSGMKRRASRSNQTEVLIVRESGF
jgi:hypothetical protein